MTGTEPMVSVVVLNYKRADDTLTCLEALATLDWPTDALEVVVVDNASGDGSAARIRAAFPDVTLIESATNTGFAGGCNLGARAATGEYLAFLNNDARPDPQWLRAAMAPLSGHTSVACVASRVLDWEGATVDFVDAALSFYGHGFKLNVGALAESLGADAHDVLFASGAAMVIRASAFHELGGFDESYFMFFEDVDLGWRLWLAGYEVRYEPASLVYHRHHASMSDVGAWREHYLLERNALFTIYKNYDDVNLARILPAAMALAIRRGVALGGDDPHSLDLSRTAIDAAETQLAHKQTLAATFAIDAFVEALPELTRARDRVQESRRRPDTEILRLFQRPLQPNIEVPYFRAGFDAALDAFAIPELFTRRRRIVVATGDRLSAAMAGPAIRAWQLAMALSREHDVQLVSTNQCEGLSHPDFPVRKVSAHEVRKLVDWCDVFIFQGHIMFENPCIAASDKIVVVDIYDPFHLEQLEQARDLGRRERRHVVQSSTDVLNQQLARGDFFTCASPKQRDFWLGQLAAVGRVNPLTYDADETLGQLVSVVPFGTSDTAPVHTRNVIKGVVPGIGADDKVVLWGGGIYNWFDPITLLHAVDRLRHDVPELRLFFLGLKHPNPHVPEMRMAVATRKLADELGLTDTHVFFNESWVEYDDRQNYFLEADVGVSTHLDHVETEFSFRTRILDYFWTGLPVVATAGDSLAELIDDRSAGITVPAGDVDRLVDALRSLLTDEERASSCAKASAALADEFRWSQALAPIVRFCRDPRRAPDLLDPEMAALMAMPTGSRTRRPAFFSFRHDADVMYRHVRSGELRTVLRKVAGRVRRLFRG